MRTLTNCLVLAGTILVGRLPVFAQNYSISWYTIDGGGGTSTGGAYSVSGTIGQPDAGTLSGGPYAITGGFWGIAVAVPTEGAPELKIVYSGANVVISWPSPSTGFKLQENVNLAAPDTWGAVGLSVVDDGTTKSVTLPAPVGTRFFRLKK